MIVCDAFAAVTVNGSQAPVEPYVRGIAGVAGLEAKTACTKPRGGVGVRDTAIAVERHHLRACAGAVQVALV